MIKKIFYRTIFFIGWLLSPFTFWNDAFINIPLSYALASVLVRFIAVKFLFLVLISYWLSNLIGIIMMYISERSIIQEGKKPILEFFKLLATLIIYSGILILLERLGVLKPI